MNNVRLTRIATNPDEGTFGAVVVNGRPICLSLEPYINENATSISCIPEGQYICKIVNSPKYGEVYEVTNVYGRSHILIHWGNWDDNTQGCVLLGEQYSIINNKWAVGSSKAAFNEFMDTLNKKDFILTITNAY